MKQYCIKFEEETISITVYGKLISHTDIQLSTRLFSFKNKIVKQKYSISSSMFKDCGFAELKSKTASIK